MSTDAQVYALKERSPLHVHLVNPKHRFRKEMPASIPARNLTRRLYTQVLRAIFDISMPRRFEKTGNDQIGRLQGTVRVQDRRLLITTDVGGSVGWIRGASTGRWSAFDHHRLRLPEHSAL